MKARQPKARIHGILIGFVLGVFLCSGCGMKQVKGPKPARTIDSVNLLQTYRVGPNDVLKVEVFDEENLTTETKVSGQGTIKFPLIGEVSVQGLTVQEVEEALTVKLQAGYLKNPKLTLAITSYRNVYVSGEAKTPGAFPFKEGLTVLKAITLAGGWTERADKGQTKVLRKIDGVEQVLTVKLEDSIQPDDIIIVPESFF